MGQGRARLEIIYKVSYDVSALWSDLELDPSQPGLARLALYKIRRNAVPSPRAGLHKHLSHPMLISCTLFFFVLIIGTVLAAPASPYVAHGRCPSPDRHITAGSTLPVSGDPDSNNRRSQLVFNVVMLRGDWFRMPMPNDLVCIFRNRTSTQSHILYSILLICQQSM